MGKEVSNVKDFPMFTTENGVASLVLRQVPYTGCAYITILDSCAPKALLKDCVDFAKAVGVDKVYGTGDPFLEQYPVYTHVLSMMGDIQSLPNTDACVFPVTDRTLEQFRTFHNEKMKDVPGAAYIAKSELTELLDHRNAYFVHRDGDLLGILIGSGERLDAVAGSRPGVGVDLMGAARSILTGERVCLEVASNNARAIRLYERLGFINMGVLKTWYKIF